jgi:uncharacterized damage-inducible protein DinB
MDPNYYKKLFAYDQWANEKVLDALEAMPSRPEEAIKKMSHILMAKAIWFSRLAPLDFTPDLNQVLPIAEARKLNGELKAKFEGYFSGLTEAKLSEKIAYKSIKGVAFENLLSDILTQLITHGPYHRGQIAGLIKKSGGTPPPTDFIVYVRE